MKRRLACLCGLVGAAAASAQLPKLDDLVKEAEKKIAPRPSQGGTTGAADDKTNLAGIKEALAVGTEKAVKSLSKPNGYFANAAVKILMPPSIQKVADLARQFGFEKKVDEFVLSMNRAAEAAAPRAARFFGDAIRAMDVEDVRGILTGGDTAATEFFRRKTGDQVHDAFKPVITQKVNQVGATRAYQDLASKLQGLPFGSSHSLDLDEYVTGKALDGLYFMVGEEEKKIRSNPLARTTELLRKVFGR